MKNEEFDEAVRKKLSEIHPAFTKTDVDKVFNHVKKGHRGFLKSSGTKWFFITITAAALLGTTIWLITRHSSKPLTSNTVQVNSLQDTIQEIPASGQPLSKNNSISEEKHLQNKQKESRDINIKPGETSLNISQETNKQGNLNPVVRDHSNLIKKENKVAVNIPIVPQPSLNDNEPEANREDQAVIEISDDKKPEEAPARINQQPVIPDVVSPAIASSEAEKTLTETAAKKEEAITIKQITEPERTSESVTGKKSAEISKKSPKISSGLLNPTVRAGISGKTSVYGNGIAANAEVLLGNHIGITTGFQYSFLYPEKYSNKEDMYGHKHHGFNHHIEGELEGEELVTDISIYNQVAQVPLAISYSLPLKKQFDLRFSVGTDFDLSLKQDLKYHFSSDSVNHEMKQFRYKGNPVPLNDLMLAIGLQKSWKGLNILLQPYVCPRLKEVSYKPKGLEYGVGISILYDIYHK